MRDEDILYDWTPSSMVEVVLTDPDKFLMIKETLQRIGIASRKDKRLFQSCFILHKQGKYFIVHFKELFILDGKYSDVTVEDIERRNRIISLLQDWELLTVVELAKIERQSPTAFHRYFSLLISYRVFGNKFPIVFFTVRNNLDVCHWCLFGFG